MSQRARRFPFRLAGTVAGLAVLCAAAAAHAFPDFGPEELVRAGGSLMYVTGASAPHWVDWNEDGLPDLVVGEGGGILPGKVRVYLNVGAAGEPAFDTWLPVQAAGQDLTVDDPG
jgi:hypothetical protein